ncbi:MAG: 5-methyltetrahydropteroyltriglutamate--homocysteine S-methyltransferase [Verrucomicrobiota bacterium JB022]|nr:5-methyltetrahydropteroyltriglutamate--homocysteine S-methyltransferase [Verrucomicrobiota bacterium JB022]
MQLVIHNLGYPRIGAKRELKRALEHYWRSETSTEALAGAACALRLRHWQEQGSRGVQMLPCNDFSYYDQMLDTACLFGNVPARFGSLPDRIDLDTYFRIARGQARSNEAAAVPAAEMTKWFDTNYHYLVPEVGPDTRFRLASDKIFVEFEEARAAQPEATPTPVLIGPLTYLKLAKTHEGIAFAPLSQIDRLTEVYLEVLERLEGQGAQWVRLDEPAFSLDLNAEERAGVRRAYERLAGGLKSLRLIVANYFGPLGDNLPTFFALPVQGHHVDAVRGREEVDAVLEALPTGRILSLGLIDGRNVWRADLVDRLALAQKALDRVGAERLWLAPSCSLQHVPVSLEPETELPDGIRSWLAFAHEKLEELQTLRAALLGDVAALEAVEASRRLQEQRRQSPCLRNPGVHERLQGLQADDFQRQSPFRERIATQQAHLTLPPFPTTTIGSFPQTDEVRAQRGRFRKGEIDEAAYHEFLREETVRCLRTQEEIGLDVLVHGEFERNDMVEYFGEQLDGFAFTRFGWVQSYGSRCVKPPLIYGDVSRRQPMTVEWSRFAQSQSTRPVKGMLTGPITILQWSFVRDDQPRRDTAFQIALAVRDEVVDLEEAGIRVIQVDEPAIREGLPLRRSDWKAYLQWAGEAFRLSTSGVEDGTQIHTHMCYSEFNDILPSIAALDADVITIEASRSNMDLLQAFVDFRYPNDIGPGVWDIHSPRVPSAEEMVRLLRRAAEVVPPERLWVNPDCGLKTRRWQEVKPALSHLVAAAHRIRG